jgi:uroporphyrinogen decarboxylase
VGIIAEAMGSEFQYPDNDLPVLQVPALTKAGIDGIKIPDPEKDGRLPVYLDAIEHAYAAVGDRVPILAYVPAPFTTGMMLCEPNKFLVDTIKDPRNIRTVMDISLRAAIEFCYAIIDAGGLPVLVDPSASASVVSPRIYREFALPYERELVTFLHRYDFDVVLHICGNTGPILDLLPETGADLISLDRVDMRAALETISKRVRLVGNYSTTALLNGPPETILTDVRQMVMQAKSAGKGYVASTGCEVPVKTPKENVKALIAAAKEAGQYWLTPDKNGQKGVP